jgi:hypothetical protein
MKTTIKILSILGCAYAMTTASSFAQSYTFDEFGNSSGLGISPGIMQPDPSGGLAANVLVYNLAFSVIPGDVLLQEPNPLGINRTSDLVRFWNPSGAGPSQIIFYSDFSTTDPADSPADTGIPSALMPLIVTLPEVGPEGNNGALYTPTANQPGSVSAAVPPPTYNIISDVPEPGTVTLIVTGAGLLLSVFKKRHQIRVS